MVPTVTGTSGAFDREADPSRVGRSLSWDKRGDSSPAARLRRRADRPVASAVGGSLTFPAPETKLRLQRGTQQSGLPGTCANRGRNTVRQRHRVPVPCVFLALVVVGLLASAPASPSGFQVMTQGARATGMGLAFTGVADDPSAIFYNPAGMGFQEHFSLMVGGSVLGRQKADFSGANPFPGDGVSESVQKQVFIVPNLYAVVPLTPELNFGLGVTAPYGLGLRWRA